MSHHLRRDRKRSKYLHKVAADCRCSPDHPVWYRRGYRWPLNHVHIVVHDHALLSRADIRNPNVCLPRHLLLKGGIPLHQARILDAEINIRRQKDSC